MRTALLTMAILTLAAIGGRASAGESTEAGAKPEVKTAPPLADLPSKPGPHIEQIKALGEGAWLKLPKTAADPNCPSWGGKSYGRTWNPRACFAPDLGGAFITGESAHGAADPKSGCYGDDVWFYDLYANRWIAIYPGTHIATFAQKLKDGTLTGDDNGILREKNGSAVPVVTLGGHGAWGLAYDKANRTFAWLGTTVNTTMFGPAEIQGPYETAMKLKLDWFKSIRDRRYGLWMYSVATGKFDFAYLPGAPDRYKASILYVDSRKQVMWVVAAKEWWYDVAAGKTSSAAHQGEAPPPQNTYGSCYDPGRDRVYVFGSKEFNEKAPVPTTEHFWYYDVKTDKWVKPVPKNAPKIQIENGRFMMEYDSVNDRVVIFNVMHTLNDPAGPNIYVCDPEANEFAAPIPVKEQDLPKGQFGQSFYCPELNAHCIYMAPRNREGNVYVWRYKRAPEAKK